MTDDLVDHLVDRAIGWATGNGLRQPFRTSLYVEGSSIRVEVYEARDGGRSASCHFTRDGRASMYELTVGR